MVNGQPVRREGSPRGVLRPRVNLGRFAKCSQPAAKIRLRCNWSGRFTPSPHVILQPVEEQLGYRIQYRDIRAGMKEYADRYCELLLSQGKSPARRAW